jgi:predicted Rossmann fold flavoprotein
LLRSVCDFHRTLIHRFDVIVLGAGAAGLMCAIEAAKRGRRVAVLEHADRIGKKILISGGGRCNFTNLHCTPENFHSANPHFCKSALARFTPGDFLALIEKHHIPYHEKTLGQLFCDRSARDVTDMLEQECRTAGVTIFLKMQVGEVRRTTEYIVSAGELEFHAPAVAIATGGLSIPKIGATGFGYDVARQFGLMVREPRPALVPLTLGGEDRSRYCDLAGVSADVIASHEKQHFRGNMLFTHRGISGPSILQVSSYWKKPEPIAIDLAPGQDVTESLRKTNHARNLIAVRAAYRDVLPVRLADRWLDLHAPQKYTDVTLAGLERQTHRWEIVPDGTEGYEKAEVTAGGIDTGELSAKTLESHKARGLYFIGEVVDVTGQLGGFNFQWAWASGFCAGAAL